MRRRVLLQCLGTLGAGAACAALARAAAGAAADPAGPSLATPAPDSGPSGAWLQSGRPTAAAREAVRLLGGAASHGLDPADYGVPALERALAAGDDAADAPAGVRLDALLDAAMTRYLSDLHRGRIDPRSIHHDFAVARDDYDAAAAWRRALAAGRLEQAVREAAPPLAQYEALRAALARYRALAMHPAWAQPLPPLPRVPSRGGTAALKPGQTYDGLARLADRLAALGDLAAPVSATARYEGAVLVDAVIAFQRRHGLAGDGVIGAATLAHLQRDPAARARQIEITLERLRWTPLLQAPRMVVVNIPEFVLRAYEVVDGRIAVRREMKVVVGRAMDRRTPLFDEPLRAIEFSPYWNVPPSIARNELVPRLRRDPGALAREGFEIVGADGAIAEAATPQRLEAVLAGRARIRQRPGERNALGDIKFVFPNRDNIYLHHTPSTGLFARDRRDFSHGCIRVEQPVALATFVLQDMPQWTEPRIREAMAARRSSTLRLARPLPVLIAYGTALVKQGRIHFYDDVYGHDRRLDEALREAHRALPPPA